MIDVFIFVLSLLIGLTVLGWVINQGNDTIPIDDIEHKLIVKHNQNHTANQSATSDAVVPLLLKALRAGGMLLLFGAQATFVGVTTSAAVLRDEDSRTHFWRWLALAGDRGVIIGLLSLGTFLLVLLLLLISGGSPQEGTIGIGIFTGIISGLLSFVAITIAVGQFATTRVADPIGEIRSKSRSIDQLRDDIENMTAKEILPTDPGAFLAILAQIFSEQAQTLENAIAEIDDPQLSRLLEEYVEVLIIQAESTEAHVDREGMLIDTLLPVLDDRYTKHRQTVRWIQATYSLPAAVDESLNDLKEIFRLMNVTRQYFKTLYLHLGFGKLGRQVILTTVIGELFSIGGVLLLSTIQLNGNTFVAALAVSLTITIGLLPLFVLFSYGLRLGTILRRTATPSGFTPEGEQPESSDYPVKTESRLEQKTDPPYL